MQVPLFFFPNIPNNGIVENTCCALTLIMNAAFVNDKINCRSLLCGSYRLIPTPEMETKIDTNKIRKGGRKGEKQE
jgi:hypothetical protein